MVPAWRKLGIVAGGGALPLHIARACAESGREFAMIRLRGLANAEAAQWPGGECGLAEADALFGLLRGHGCDAVVLAGVVRRPNFAALMPDARGAALLPRIIAAAAKGDGAILSLVVREFEREGFRVIGAEEAEDGLAAPRGALGAFHPTADHLADVARAASVVSALGPFDVGQGAVVARGVVVAIEAMEGTDAMLERCVGLNAQGGVLVKRPKPGQEIRVDLPTIGVATIRRAAQARLAGIAVAAGRALIVGRQATVAEADRLGLFVYGFTGEEFPAP
jgi:DUF1009 family protein